MSKNKAHVADWKKDEVSRVQKLLEKYKVIAVADMTNMPSMQLQKLRSSVKNSTVITMAKGSLIKLALENVKDKVNLKHLEEHIRGMPALLLTNDNPFRLAKLLKKSKSLAPAKPGQLAPNDILIPAGPTSFAPGPVIGELSAIGLKTAVVDGKIAIKEDKIVVKDGEIISAQIASVLARLGITPMEIGINLLAAYENGVIFTKDTLNIDETAIMNQLKTAAQGSFNLAAHIGYTTKDNIKLLLAKAFRTADKVAEKGNILTINAGKKELAKANLQAEHLRNKFNLPDSPEEPEIKKKFDLESKQEVKENIQENKKEEKTEEQIAQEVLRRLQDEKMNKKVTERTQDKRFKDEEKTAQDVLKKAQDKKMEKDDKSKFKPRGFQ